MRELLNRKLCFSLVTVVIYLGFTAGSYGRTFVYVASTQTEPLAVGEQMHLSIQIAGGNSVSGYELTVGFDPTALRYIEGANADYLPAGAFAVPAIASDNTVYVAATSLTGVASASEGTLATLTFEVIAAKGSTIKLMGVTLSDSAGMPLAVTTSDGRIVATQLPKIWDVNEDQKVNILDLTLVASSLGAATPAPPRADVNGDGTVNILDLVMVAQNLDAVGGNKNEPEVRVTLEEVRAPTAFVVSANPPNGSEIAANSRITVTFDNAPADVTVSAGVAFPAGKTVTINGPFTPGALSLTITWADGSQTLTYTVTAPDNEAPKVTGGTVKDGDKDVDPEMINTDAKIEIEFSEDVSGNIALQTEGGDDVGWLGKVEGNKGTLELVKGKEIGNETTYVIVGKVSDAAGNETEVKVTFVTKRKE